MSSLLNNIVLFCTYCRNAGFQVGLKETHDSLNLIQFGFIKNKMQFKYALRAILCSSHEEWLYFDILFEGFWKKRENGAYTVTDDSSNSSSKKRENNENNVFFSTSTSVSDDTEESDKPKSGLTASSVEKMKSTDFTKIKEISMPMFETIAQRFYRQMIRRISRKQKSMNIKTRVDLRKTMRVNLKYGGYPINLKYKSKIKQRRELLIFSDVSGSMDQYSFHFLKFVIHLHKHFRKIHTFIFSTRMLEITDLLNQGNQSKIIDLLYQQAKIWSSGTTMGDCFNEFNRSKSANLLAKRPLVIIFSDGLDTGDPEVLYDEIKTIKNKSKKILWINPLKGMKDYEPITKAMSRILPLLDEFRPGHNMDSLLDLEECFVDVL